MFKRLAIKDLSAGFTVVTPDKAFDPKIPPKSWITITGFQNSLNSFLKKTFPSQKITLRAEGSPNSYQRITYRSLSIYVPEEGGVGPASEHSADDVLKAIEQWIGRTGLTKTGDDFTAQVQFSFPAKARKCIYKPYMDKQQQGKVLFCMHNDEVNDDRKSEGQTIDLAYNVTATIGVQISQKPHFIKLRLFLPTVGSWEQTKTDFHANFANLSPEDLKKVGYVDGR